MTPTRVDTDHPPVARGVVCIDYDGTIFPWGALDDDTPPYSYAVDTINELYEHGYTVVILTSRLSPTWWDSEGWDHNKAQREQMALITGRLARYHIPYSLITSEKVPAQYYIDDKAIRFDNKQKDFWLIVNMMILGDGVKV